MKAEDAILGVFLATYSSKGDHLPLRYPLTQFDYEYAKSILSENEAAEARKRSTRLSKEGNLETAELQDRGASETAHTDGRGRDGMASRNDSYTSIATAMTQPKGSTKDVRASESASSVRLFTSGSLAAELESESDRRPCMEQSMHGFETKFLAQLFSPKPSMSDQRFQVAIDKVLFVGHPLRDDPNERAQDPDYYDTEQDEAESMSRFASMTDFDGWKAKSDMMVGRASRHHGTRLLADLGLLNLLMHREPSEAGDSAISEGEWAVRDSKEWKRRGYRKPRYDSLFHIVFMLDNTAPAVEALANLLYEHVLKRLTKALQIEQNGANYVLTESRLIRTLNDMALKDRYTSARYIQELVARSTLACDLIKLYNGLRNNELVNLHIHKRIMVSLQIPSGPRLDRPVPATRPRAFFNSGYGQTGYNSNNFGDRSNVVSLAATPRLATPSESASASALDVTTAGQLQLSQSLDALQQVSQSVAPPVQEYWGPALFAPNQSGDAGFNYESNGAMVHGLPGKQWGHTHQGKGMARALVEQADVIVTGRELREHRHGLYPRIKPYHALLLLGDTDALRQQLLFADASPTLVAVIERATPTKTLAMLHTLVDCSFAQLCRLVAHLVYWNVARVVCPVNLGYTYIPTLEQLAPALISQFNSQGFRLCSLPKLLALLHPPRPVIHVLEALGLNEKPKPSSSAKDDGGRDLIRHERRAELREMIVFLLRQGAVAQFHTWPILLVPNYVKFDLDQEQFVSLALAWFSTLYTEHPDLLGAFPQSLLNSGEIEKWAYGLKHDREAGDDVGAAFRQVEYQAVMCKVMCKIALRRVRDKWIERMHEKHGQELRRMERQMAEEEQKVNAFCARLEQQKFDVWGQTKIRFSTYIEMQTRQRSKALDEDGPPVFTAHNPDMATFTREVVEKYVTFVPTDGHEQGTDAEKRYIAKLLDKKRGDLQDWFLKHSHFFDGKHHLVEIVDFSQTSLSKVEYYLAELSDILLLPRHI